MSSLHRSLLSLASENGWQHLLLELPNSFATRIRSAAYSSAFRAHVRIGRNPVFRGLKRISIGNGFVAGDGLWLEAITRYRTQKFSPHIEIGRNVLISHWGHISSTRLVRIGDNVLIGSKVIITDHNHGDYSKSHSSPEVPPADRPLTEDQQVLIGENVWIGDGVVITPGTIIGKGAVVAANSVLKGEIPPFTIVAGIPAKIIKRYDFVMQQWIKSGEVESSSQ